MYFLKHGWQTIDQRFSQASPYQLVKKYVLGTYYVSHILLGIRRM